jgi:hypothetical protein
LVGERSDNVVASTNAHRNRRATIVMDGKANGEFNVGLVLESHIRISMFGENTYLYWQ